MLLFPESGPKKNFRVNGFTATLHLRSIGPNVQRHMAYFAVSWVDEQENRFWRLSWNKSSGVDGWMGGWMGRGRGQGGDIGLALLWSKIKKGNITLSFASPHFFLKTFLLWSDCEAIFWKRPTNHYSQKEKTRITYRFCFCKNKKRTIDRWWWCLLFVLAETKNRSRAPYIPWGRYVP